MQEKMALPPLWQRVNEEKATIVEGKLVLPLWQENGRPKYDRQWAIAAHEAGQLPPVLPFWGHTPAADGRLTKACFSQWWASDFVFGDICYCCMEQLMMAGKALAFEDMDTLALIMAQVDPKAIKHLGRRITPFDEQVWHRVKHSLIVNGNYAKFTQNEELCSFLLSTGDSMLVEASPYDTIWGIGLGEEQPEMQDPHQWRGQNLLGFALMEVRDEIRRNFADAQPMA